MVDLVKQVAENTMPEHNHPDIYPGDEVRVHLRIVEGTRERIQVVGGMVIRLKGSGMNKTFTVRRIAAHGVGVERGFLYHSPRIEKIEVLRHSKVRRAQLYYMRERRGKKARLKEIRKVNRNK
jgi:large subunit ribosomal protein L19